MENGFIILTENELEEICVEFFDRGYYANLYRTKTTDNSTDVYEEYKNDVWENLIKKFKKRNIN